MYLIQTITHFLSSKYFWDPQAGQGIVTEVLLLLLLRIVTITLSRQYIYDSADDARDQGMVKGMSQKGWLRVMEQGEEGLIA